MGDHDSDLVGLDGHAWEGVLGYRRQVLGNLDA